MSTYRLSSKRSSVRPCNASTPLMTACLVMVMYAVPPVAAGIVVIDQSRTLKIDGSYLPVPDLPSPPAPYSQTLAADPYVRFHRSIEDSSSAGEFSASSYADQDSVLTVSDGKLVFNATGNVHGTAIRFGSMASSSSNFSITFSLDAASDYLLDVRKIVDSISMPISDVRLTQGSELIAGLAQFPREFTSRTFTGTLSPGTYELKGVAFGSGGPDHYEAGFVADFTVAQSTPTAVPLPSAAWSGASALVGLVAWRRLPRNLRPPAAG